MLFDLLQLSALTTLFTVIVTMAISLTDYFSERRGAIVSMHPDAVFRMIDDVFGFNGIGQSPNSAMMVVFFAFVLSTSGSDPQCSRNITTRVWCCSCKVLLEAHVIRAALPDSRINSWQVRHGMVHH